jgi:hypothetical protein
MPGHQPALPSQKREAADLLQVGMTVANQPSFDPICLAQSVLSGLQGDIYGDGRMYRRSVILAGGEAGRRRCGSVAGNVIRGNACERIGEMKLYGEEVRVNWSWRQWTLKSRVLGC